MNSMRQITTAISLAAFLLGIGLMMGCANFRIPPPTPQKLILEPTVISYTNGVDTKPVGVRLEVIHTKSFVVAAHDAISGKQTYQLTFVDDPKGEMPKDYRVERIFDRSAKQFWGASKVDKVARQTYFEDGKLICQIEDTSAYSDSLGIASMKWLMGSLVSQAMSITEIIDVEPEFEAATARINQLSAFEYSGYLVDEEGIGSNQIRHYRLDSETTKAINPFLSDFEYGDIWLRVDGNYVTKLEVSHTKQFHAQNEGFKSDIASGYRLTITLTGVNTTHISKPQTCASSEQFGVQTLKS